MSADPIKKHALRQSCTCERNGGHGQRTLPRRCASHNLRLCGLGAIGALPRRRASQALRSCFVAFWANSQAKRPIVRLRRGSAVVPHTPSISFRPVRRVPGTKQRAGGVPAVRIFHFCTGRLEKRSNLVRFFRFCTSGQARAARRRGCLQRRLAFSPFRELTLSRLLLSARHPLPPEGCEHGKRAPDPAPTKAGGTKTKNSHEVRPQRRTGGTKTKNSHSGHVRTAAMCAQRASLLRCPYRKRGSPDAANKRSPRIQPEGCRLFWEPRRGLSSRSPYARRSARDILAVGVYVDGIAPYARECLPPRRTSRRTKTDRPTRAGSPTLAGESMRVRCTLQHRLGPQGLMQQTMPAWRSRSAQGGDQEDCL